MYERNKLKDRINRILKYLYQQSISRGKISRSSGITYNLCLKPSTAASVSGSYEACRGYVEQLRRKSSLESFSALNERDKFLLRAPGSSRTRGREFTTAIKISLKLFMGNAYVLLSPSKEKGG